MADRKYLAVYGKGATEVVGRIVEVWRNESRNSDGYGTLTTNRPTKGEGGWSRHLALQDMTGGLNYIGPRPDLNSGNLYYRDIMMAVPEEKAKSMLKESEEGKLHVLRHVTGELPAVSRIDMTEMTPNIEKQLEYGEKMAGTITRTAKGGTWTDMRWKWNEEALDHGADFASKIKAVTPVDDPIIPIIVTGVQEEKGKGVLRIEGVNPLDWKRESFRLTGVSQTRAELETLRNTPGSIRMFRPRKYYSGSLNQAEIVHADKGDGQSEDKERMRLKSNYETAMKRLLEYTHQGEHFDKNYIQLQIAGTLLFRTPGFKETLLLAKSIMTFGKDSVQAEKITAILNETDRMCSEKLFLSIDQQKMADVLKRIQTVMSNPVLQNVQFGDVKISELTSMGPEEGVTDRCMALLRALREYGGELCNVDRDRKAILWRMEGNTFEKPDPVKPKESGIDVLPSLAEKHLNALADKKTGHMYMATRNSILVLSADHEEDAKDTSKRLAGKIGESTDYMSPDERGRVKIPLYRSGYSRRLPGCDVKIQVSPTIADTWVLPTTARKYYVRLMDELSAKKPGTDDGTENIGVDVAEKVREILSADGKGDMSHEERLSKLGQIASEISGETKSSDKAVSKRNASSSRAL